MKPKDSILVVFVAAVAVWFGGHYFLKDRTKLTAEHAVHDYVRSRLHWREGRYDIHFTNQQSENGEWIIIVNPEEAFGRMVSGVSVRVFFDPDSQQVTRHTRF